MLVLCAVCLASKFPVITNAKLLPSVRTEFITLCGINLVGFADFLTLQFHPRHSFWSKFTPSLSDRNRALFWAENALFSFHTNCTEISTHAPYFCCRGLLIEFRTRYPLVVSDLNCCRLTSKITM